MTNDQFTQTILRDTLQAVADQTTPTPDWDRLLADLANDEGRAPAHQTKNRGRIMMAAAALVLFAGGAYEIAKLDNGADVSVAAGIDYVLPGEAVLSRDPLIVAAAPGPEPLFETSQLGRELTWQPVDSVTVATRDVIARTRQMADEDSSITKVVAVGSVNGDAVEIVITDGPNNSGLLGEPVSANQRMRWVFVGGGGTGSGDLVPAASLDMIAMPPSSAGEPIDGAGYVAPSGWVTWTGLPSDASVASFADDDTQMWIRVRSGVAVFPAEFSQGETFHLVALDADGNELGRFDETVTLPEDPNPGQLEVGDVLNQVNTVDVDGNAVTLDGSGTTVLVYGASWCPHCDSVMADILPVLEALGDDVTVYSIAATDGPDGEADPWPPGQDWPFTRLAPDPGSVLLGSEGYPQTVVLGEGNEVIGSFAGFDDYAQNLTKAGAGS